MGEYLIVLATGPEEAPLIEITPAHVSGILFNMNPVKSTGPDDIYSSF